MYLQPMWLIFVYFLSIFNCEARHDVLGIGQALLDVYVKCSDENLSAYIGNSINKGDSVLTNYEKVKELQDIIKNPSKQNSGGAVANTIVGVASLGGEAGFVGAIAPDLYGQLFKEDMKNMGVKSFFNYITDPASATGVVYSFISTDDGERTMLAWPGISHYIDYAMIKKEILLTGAKTILSEGYMWYNQQCAEIVKQAFNLAKEHSIERVFSFSSPFVVGTFKDQFKELLSGNVDIVVGNEKEFKIFFDVETLEQIINSVRAYPNLKAIITRGKEGAIAITPSEAIEAPVEYEIDKDDVTDTTGAGDIFLAGFLYGHTHEISIKDSMRLGNLLAGKLIQQIGARPEFNVKETLNTFLSENS